MELFFISFVIMRDIKSMKGMVNMKRRTSKIIAVALFVALTLGFNGTTALAAVTTGAQETNAIADTTPATDITPATGTTKDAQTPSITTQPGNVNANVNDNITLSVTANATDGGTLTFQWFMNTVESTTGGALINGATSASFSPSTGFEGTLFYYVIVTNTITDENGVTASDITSTIARVTVSTAPQTNAQTPSITTNPRDNIILINDRVTLSVTAQVTDGGTLSYQWFSNTNDRNTGGTAISGATGREFRPPTDREGTTYYYVEVTNTNNNVNGTRTARTVSGTAMVTVNIPVNAQIPNIVSQSEGGNVTLGDRIVLSVTADVRDRGSLSYQWFSNTTDSNTGGTLIRGANGETFTPPTDTIGTTYYYVQVTNTTTTRPEPG